MNILYEQDCEFYTNKLENGIRTFTAKPGKVFKEVEYEQTGKDNIIIWSTDNSNEYANKTEYDTKTGQVTIHLINGGTKVYKKDAKQNKWTDTSSGQGGTPTVNKTGIELNIKDSSNNNFDITEDKTTKIITFTPKGNNAFKTVKHGNTKIWETSDPKEFSNKVVKEDDNKVTIYMGDGSTTKVYKKSGNNWTEDTSATQTGTDDSQGATNQSVSGGVIGASGGPTAAGSRTGSKAAIPAIN